MWCYDERWCSPRPPLPPFPHIPFATGGRNQFHNKKNNKYGQLLPCFDQPPRPPHRRGGGIRKPGVFCRVQYTITLPSHTTHSRTLSRIPPIPTPPQFLRWILQLGYSVLFSFYPWHASRYIFPSPMLTPFLAATGTQRCFCVTAVKKSFLPRNTHTLLSHTYPPPSLSTPHNN